MLLAKIDALNTYFQPGKWRYVLRSSRRSLWHVDVSVTSEPRQKHRAIRVNAWIMESEVEFPKRAVIYANVHRAFLPVIHAEVTARIDTPQGGAYNIMLMDDGAGEYKNARHFSL